MISLSTLAELAAEHGEDLRTPVPAVTIGGRVIDAGAPTAVMGVLNLSRDSTYRASIATSVDAAVRRGTAMAAQGADFVDLGAESSTATAARIAPEDQIRLLVPVVRGLAAAGVVVSVETYRPDVVRAVLEAGARILNYTGTTDEELIFDLVAGHDASLVLCHVTGADVRQMPDVDLGADPLAGIAGYFADRCERARDRGVTGIAVDPGVGFSYRNLADPMTRLQYQTRVILNSFRLRRLGYPVCQALPHGLDLFEDRYRSGEAFFAVLAHLGGVNILRTHEVPEVLAVLRSLTEL